MKATQLCVPLVTICMASEVKVCSADRSEQQQLISQDPGRFLSDLWSIRSTAAVVLRLNWPPQWLELQFTQALTLKLWFQSCW